jgi:AcrR family transcriptional regulator
VIYDAYEPVFVTFQTAVVSDEMVASGASLVASRSFQDLRSRIEGSPRRSSEVDSVVRAVLQTVGRLNRETELIEQLSARGSLNRDRINVAYADTVHRALFGPDDQVNVHTTTKRLRPMVKPVRPSGPAGDGVASHGPAAQRTRQELLAAGHEVFVARGYYAARVADIVKAAGVSHGVFYRYFDNKAALFRLLAEQASHELNQAVDGFPNLFDGDGDPAADLRAWLRVYATTYAAESSIFTMWSEAISRDEELVGASGAAIDGTRARLARHLEPRGWGDADADGMVLLVFLDAMTASPPTARRIEHMARIIERSLLTGPTSAPPPRR